MARVARNAPCPCGSGRKFKKCCGLTREQELDLLRRLEVAREIAMLPQHFPRLRPAGEAFERWADGVAGGELEDAQLDEALALIEQEERDRIVRAQRDAAPGEWGRLVEGLGDEELAEQALVAGSVVAALRDRRPPDPLRLELVDELERLQEDPCEALAMALAAEALWSLEESRRAEAAVAAIPDELDDDAYGERWEEVLAREAERMTTGWHRERLEWLVARLRAQAIGPYAKAAAAIAEGCARFERDEELRRRLAAMLLADSLGRVRLAELEAARAA
jgi:hypothetical protein